MVLMKVVGLCERETNRSHSFDQYVRVKLFGLIMLVWLLLSLLMLPLTSLGRVCFYASDGSYNNQCRAVLITKGCCTPRLNLPIEPMPLKKVLDVNEAIRVYTCPPAQQRVTRALLRRTSQGRATARLSVISKSARGHREAATVIFGTR